MRKKDKQALVFASTKLSSFLAASRGEKAGCAVFDSLTCEPFSEAQKTAIRIYLETWVAEPLSSALDAIDGSRDWENEGFLDSLSRG